MNNSESTLSPHLSLSGPDVPSPEPLPEVTATGSQSSLRKRSRSTIQHFKDKFHANRGGSELDGRENSGSKSNRSESHKGDRRTSRFAEWRKKNFGGGLKRRSNEQVRQSKSNHKTESPKSHRGKFNFRKTPSSGDTRLVDPHRV